MINREYTFKLDSSYLSFDKDNNVVNRLLEREDIGCKLPSTAQTFTTFEL
jgi:hypothetical protein